MKGKKIITVLLVVCLLSILLTIPAFATVTDSSGDGFSLYNGYKVPNIDSVWDEVVCPYVFIKRNFIAGTIEGYTLYMSSQPYYIDYVTTDSVQIKTSGPSYYREFLVVIYASNDLLPELEAEGVSVGEWILVNDNYSDSGSIQIASPIDDIWSNHTIVDRINNTNYLVASDPIPLDGYNLIEWDGDTNGLFYDNNSAILAYEYYPAYDAFSVMELSYAQYPVVISGFSTSTDDTASGWIVAPPTSDYAFSAASVVNGDVSYTMALKFDDIDDTGYTKMIAYRSVESPPDEGGGDDDDPQPPLGG